MAGHSKWAQIKHRKSITDAKKGQLFSKLVCEIMVAAREGGPKPETNSRLRQAAERAQSQGLPKDNIEKAINRAMGTDEGKSLQEFLYEATAPGGIAIIIEGITDSKNRTLAEIKHILNERGARLAESGSLIWNFEKSGSVELSQETNTAKSQEEIELDIIESGARDFQYLNGTWLIETDFPKLEKVRQNLEAAGLKIKEVYHDYKTRAPIELAGKAKEVIEKLLDELSLHNDVQEIYTNIA